MLFAAIKFTIQLVSFIVSIIFNFTLIYLILTRSPKKMGTYKYLLIYFCCFSILYSILDIIVEPFIQSHGSCFFMMMNLGSWKSYPEVGFLFVTILCGCFAVSITTISIQFVFRYFALERKGRITYFRGHYLIVWFIVPLVSASIWITQLWVFQHPNSVTSAYLSETVFVNYGMNISDITYTGSLFYPPDEHGVPHLDLMQLFSYLGFCVTMGTTFSTVVVFGMKSYKLVCELPQLGESEYTYKLQSQLFRALVVQAFIPITFLFLPIGILFTAPLLHFDIEPASFLVTIFYSIYPAVDPLPIIFIVVDYRDGLVELVGHFLCKKNNQVNTSYTDQQVASIS
ncbi:Serpentine receptor class r-10 [Caenorhabditis elegans]|uniref:Serpentine receptor class r-10 n=1 Tax=Caenorhabditis elegans TaxID=6239 RepID=Q9N2S8_CAEEL|nr:Seven TM Receptor [Caenorhabditis elegans]CCD68687.1 Seven TM Receptor [Caenorhabditis elegans]|eukprot:NP_001023592.1 Seven TM Receptor [Caenorhabditis elegans]